ncbi:MAG: winged helix-turn-helix domain-containing protein, partial [Candidatus Nitrosomaritimum yanchengensis]
MVSYRTSMQIVGDLLSATEQSGQEGIKTTYLLTKANLSHSRLAKFLSNLTGAGLINKIEFDGKNTFVITPKGRQYLESYMKFA